MNYIKNKWNMLLRQVNQRGLQFMISVSFTLVALVGMVFIGVFLFQSYGQAVEEMMLNDKSQIINQVEINLTTYLRSMMRISDAMYYNVIKKVDLQSDDIGQELNLLYEVNKDSLVSIACFSQEGELIGAAPAGNIKKNVDITEQSWFADAEERMENLHFSKLHVQNIFENSNGRYYWVVSLSRGVELTQEGKTSGGILLVDMNFSGIRQIFTEINSRGMGYVYLVNNDGELIYHPKQNLIFSNMLKENNLMASRYDDGVHEERFQGEERTVIVKTVGYTGWKIVSVTPKADLVRDFDSTKIMAVIIIILAVTLMIFANQFVALQIAKPLKKLENSLQGIGVDLRPEIYIGGSPEIQHLGETIRSMVEQLRELTDDIVREQEEKRKSELDALQSQINPHFLYNTLEAVNWRAKAIGEKDISSMVESLGTLMRETLNTKDKTFTVRRELEIVKSYLTIQQIRFEDRLEYTIQIDDSIMDISLPHLTIQPLVENAINYAMEESTEVCHIQIEGTRSGDNVYIDVVNNDSQFEPDLLRKLDQGLVTPHGFGIGLLNIHKRIQLTYGSEYGLHLFNKDDEHAVARIIIPGGEHVKTTDC